MDRVRSVQELIARTRHMPLERMRFFINEDRREPRCFGIYQEPESGFWVVYKNKADGSRAVRYHGPDEAYAAQELWAKIQSETALRRGERSKPKKGGLRRSIGRWGRALLVAAVVLALELSLTWLFNSRGAKTRSGYYVVDDGVYYLQGSDWYAFEDGAWSAYDAPSDDDWYGDGYYGRDYDGFEDETDAFERSPYYDASSGDDDGGDGDLYDSWDSGDTDWDSDW